MSKFFPFSDITRAQKNSPILAYQTLPVKPYINPCYNLYMGRNHFSKHGGPYFINDGVTRHADKPYDIPSKGFFYLILSGFVITLAAIVTLLYLL
jgi:hypothetical protein